MLTIYGVHNSRAARVIWLAYELNITFRQVPIIQAYKLAGRAPGPDPVNTRSPEFLRVNPAGLIPAIDDDGLVLAESLAITLYLARKHGGPVAPQDIGEEGQAMMWSFWAATEIEGHALDIMRNRVMRPPEERDGILADAAEAVLNAKFPVLERALARTGWLVGSRFTVADLNVAEVVRYASAAPALFRTHPNIKKWLDACHQRPAFQRMWTERANEKV
ncbi:MAG TPA: glutathione S-transferase family protein [Beijerinckiaceae bacterium]|nr:glutathione S-transferase family protein [Beijerinckiaceae bacterium]